MAKANDTTPRNINIQNRRAGYEYSFLVKYTAGMVLVGTEIKSLRTGNGNITDGYCTFGANGTLWLHGVTIAQYTQGTYNNHEPTRPRQLLLTKKEMRQLENKSQEQGLTIVPLRIFIGERGFAKVEIALARGKKLYDKREDMKARDAKRELDRNQY